MKLTTIRPTLAALAFAAAAVAIPASAATPGGAHGPRFSDPTRIDNPYLPLSEQRQCVMRGQEAGERRRSVKTVLSRTRGFEIGGHRVPALIVRDRAFENGTLIERALDYFAQADDGTVYYLGEQVNYFRNGRLVGHKGTWLYGRDTQRIGVAMPADPRVGDIWESEHIPGLAVESDRVIGRPGEVRVRGRSYPDAIRIRAYVRPDHEVEHKTYARGVGVVQELPPEGRLGLVRCDGPPSAAAAARSDAPSFSDPTRIDNPYLPLSKFSRCTLKGHEGDQKLRIKRQVLDRTRTFDVESVSVETTVVKDRVWADGKLIESTHDFFAQSDDGTVHYFGERVDNIRNGHVVDHHGSWLYGKDTQKIGVLMAGDPHIGRHWLSEDASPITVEHDRVVSEIASVEVRGRTYDQAIKVREYALPDKEVEYKIYAKGVGVIEELPPEGDVGLVGCK